MTRTKAFVPLAAGFLFTASLLIAPALAQQDAIPRTPHGKPDFSGFWTLPYTPNLAVASSEDRIPYTAAGLAAFRARDLKDDPTSLCLYPGVPRIMQSPYPVQFVQTEDSLVMLFEYMRLWRSIPIGKPHPERVEPTFMGDSAAHWEGDTLVIETIGLNDRTWLDTAGHQHSDQLRVVERLTRTPDGVAYDFDIVDPVMYSKPWSHVRKLTPLEAVYGLPTLIEYSCNENNKDLDHLISTKPAPSR